LPIETLSINQSIEKAKYSDVAIEASKKQGERQTGKRIFLICENCHWCATLTDASKTGGMEFSCPSCKRKESLSSVPIAENEAFRFSFSEKHGVELDFLPPAKK